jgi:hypothetical protein
VLSKVSRVSAWASKWIQPTGPSVAMALRIGRVMVWSPPAVTGTTPAAWSVVKNA